MQFNLCFYKYYALWETTTVVMILPDEKVTQKRKYTPEKSSLYSMGGHSEYHNCYKEKTMV